MMLFGSAAMPLYTTQLRPMVGYGKPALLRGYYAPRLPLKSSMSQEFWEWRVSRKEYQIPVSVNVGCSIIEPFDQYSKHDSPSRNNERHAASQLLTVLGPAPPDRSPSLIEAE